VSKSVTQVTRAASPEEALRGAGAAAVLMLAGIFLLIAAVFLFAPKLGAAVFGIPTEEAGGLDYVRALALRDLALGLYLLGLLRFSSRRAIGIVLAATLVIPAGDLLLILAWHGLSSPGYLLLHGASGACVAAVAIRLLRPRHRAG
jgi:hypothetical protein